MVGEVKVQQAWRRGPAECAIHSQVLSSVQEAVRLREIRSLWVGQHGTLGSPCRGRTRLGDCLPWHAVGFHRPWSVRRTGILAESNDTESPFTAPGVSVTPPIQRPSLPQMCPPHVGRPTPDKEIRARTRFMGISKRGIGHQRCLGVAKLRCSLSTLE